MDRSRDDNSVLDFKALKNTTYQVEDKMFSPFNSGQIVLFDEIDPNNASFVWDSEGEVQLILKKKQRKVWPSITVKN